ncbi:MAG TPA: PTS sugar transporter subunit IIA [Caulifigura sp.]|jgi:PTS system nitrogen regulatory IIA component|nr:PTS sugar transporter subunit IIA [Caulifigura sp.]
MDQEWLTLSDLAKETGRDQRELERLTLRGRIPAHKRGNDWQYHTAEIRGWMEQELRGFSDAELASFEQSQAETSPVSETLLSTYLAPEQVQVPLEGRTKRSILEALVETAGRTWKVWEPAVLLQAVIDRESAMSTAFEKGVAIPHPRQPLAGSLEEAVVAFGRTTSPIPFGAADNSGTDLFFLVACRDTRTHLRLLARLGRLIQKPGFLEELRTAETSADAFRILSGADQLMESGAS